MESNNGLSLSAVVFIVLLTLKLSDVIDWSWWWITLPLWWMLPMIFLVIIFAFIIVLFEQIGNKVRDQD
jgi:hypothetical protein